MVRYTACRRIYEKFSFLTRPRGQNGRILRPSHAMSGSAGLSPSRNRKPEGSTLSVYARNLKKECADLVAGQAVLTAEIKTAYLYSTSCSSHSHGAAPLFQYRRAERLLTRQVRSLSNGPLRGCAQVRRATSEKSFPFNTTPESKGFS